MTVIPKCPSPRGRAEAWVAKTVKDDDRRVTPGDLRVLCLYAWRAGWRAAKADTRAKTIARNRRRRKAASAE